MSHRRPVLDALNQSPRPRPTAARAPVLARALLWTAILAGVGGLAWSLNTLRAGTDWRVALFMLVAATLAELLKVTIYEAKRETLSFSLSFVAIMMATTTEPALGPLSAFVAGLVHVLVARQRVPTKFAFNIANLVVAATGASQVYVLLHPSDGGFGLAHLWSAAWAVLTFYVLNVGVISAMISLHSGRPLGTVLRDSAWFGPTSLLLGLTGAFVGGIHGSLGTLGSVMFMVPVLLMRFTLAFYARRSAATIQDLDRLARHDALTGLPNRVELNDRLQERFDVDTAQPFALLMMDLDRFKEINDTFGHHHGDMLLQQVGPRLRSVLAADELAARLGGDEFAVVLPAVDGPLACRRAEQILAALQAEFVVAGHRLDVSASIGIAVAPADGHDPTTLVRNADVAMYAAKRDHTGFALHTAEHDQYSPERLSLLGDLRRAVDAGELILHFQPKVDLQTGDTRGAEALVRWQHPDRGLIPPDMFIPLAEHAGLIKALTRHVLGAALTECRRWLDRGWDLSVAVNASAHDLRDPSFPELIERLLAAHAVPPNCLRIEVTESAMMADLSRARDILSRLRSLGVGVSIDDFGTGYASLTYLKRLPVDELKLDRSFVRNVSTDREDAAIVRSTIALAHDLGLRVVAEGAEDLGALEHLRRLGCDQVQGYVLARPLSAAAFADWILVRAAKKRVLAGAA